jgi:hypothetical protein
VRDTATSTGSWMTFPGAAGGRKVIVAPDIVHGRRSKSMQLEDLTRAMPSGWKGQQKHSRCMQGIRASRPGVLRRYLLSAALAC